MTTWTCSRTNELKHHGIKGQKWGVRRFQNKDGSLTLLGKKRYRDDDIIIEKGSKQRHISEKREIQLNNKETYLYDPKNKHDKKVYEGAYAMYIEVGKGYMDKYVHEYETTKTLRMPSNKRSVDIFIKSYRNNPAPYINEMNQIKDYYRELSKTQNMSESNRKVASYNKQYTTKTSDEDLKEYGYATLNQLTNYGSRGSAAIRAYYESLKLRGYNALVDDNNKSIYNDAVQPIITLNAKKTLKEIGVTKLSDDEMFDNINELEKYMEEKYKGKRHMAL